MTKKENIDKNEEVELDEYVDITLEERVEAIEKKTNIIIGLLVVVLIFSLITMIVGLNGKGSKETSNDQSEAAAGNTYDTSAFKEISASDIKSESKGKTIVVLLARQGCSYCVAFVPIITQVAEEYGVTIRYLDYSKIVDVEQSVIKDESSYNTIYGLKGNDEWDGFGETALSGTPNTFFIKDNKIIYGINGYNEQSVVESAFEAAGFSK